MNSRIILTTLLIWAAAGCKFQSQSELKATPAQKNKLRACIISTVVEAFPETEQNLNEVGLFASELVQNAPTLNKSEEDPAFEAYVNDLGCDPNKQGGSDNFGLTIVEQWIASPHNHMAFGPKDSSATVKRSSN